MACSCCATVAAHIALDASLPDPPGGSGAGHYLPSTRSVSKPSIIHSPWYGGILSLPTPNPAFIPYWAISWSFMTCPGSVSDHGLGAHEELGEVTIVRDARPYPEGRVVPNVDVSDGGFVNQPLDQLFILGDHG